MKRQLPFHLLLLMIPVCLAYTGYAQPSNNECATAITLTPGVTNTSGTVRNATASASIPVGCATGNPDDDVWYKFTAVYSYATITLSNIGSALSSSGAKLQLFSGACGSLSSVACGTGEINVTGLTAGNTYYIRVYSAGTGQTGFTNGNSVFYISVSPSAAVVVGSGRMKEVYQQTILSSPKNLADPWEVTYGPDDHLWVTESKGYRLYRIDPVTGARDTVLDISQGSSFLTAPDNTNFNVQFSSTQNPWPQGGFAGMALHPLFLDGTTPKNYVYISYVRTYNGGSSPTGIFFTNYLVRFTYNTGTGKLESPVALCDTIPGSNDHNSQRMIIAPVGGTDYLFYAAGDMGAGQFSNKNRTNKAQSNTSYEGKILRFNLEPDGDAGTLDKWIPNDNPFNATLGVQSAVWATGIRNNQGFAYNPSTNKLYGSSHGPYSDDEINVIETAKNYGHPLVIGYAADNNYNGSSAGAPNTTSSCPVITSETANAASIGASYKDPLFSAYAPSQAVVNNIWTTNPSNATWPSEAWSGLDLYTHTLVPGWHESLVAASLKWGRVLRLKLDASGDNVVPTDGYDTVSYFGSTNRFRDLAFSPNGKDIFVIMDSSATTSGPSAANPVVPSCKGCLQKYTFLGYADGGGKSTIPDAIDVTAGTAGACTTGTTITIDDTNNYLWVPITGPDGNIMAEIKANGQNLGQVTSSFYINSGAIRQYGSVKYLDRNMTITPAVQPSSPVDIRLYMSKAEYDALDADAGSGINAITDLNILKNNDACGNAIASNTTLVSPVYAEAHGSNGYMLQGSISSFSSFYFGSANATLPLQLLSFSGALQRDKTVLLKWKTENERQVSRYIVERSTDGASFTPIGTVAATGNINVQDYSLTDNTVAQQASSVFYYRLKSVDLDNTYSYSNVVTIVISDFVKKITVSPNSVLDKTKVIITLNSDSRMNWKLLDNTGRVIRRNEMQLIPGSNILEMDMNGLPSGVYILHMTGDAINENVKIQKL